MRQSLIQSLKRPEKFGGCGCRETSLIVLTVAGGWYFDLSNSLNPHQVEPILNAAGTKDHRHNTSTVNHHLQCIRVTSTRPTAAAAVAASNFPSDVISGWVCDIFLLECVMGVSAFCPMTFENTGKKNTEIISYPCLTHIGSGNTFKKCISFPLDLTLIGEC